MDRWVSRVAGLVRALAKIWEKKWSFFVVGVAVFALNVASLAALDPLPSAPLAIANTLVKVANDESATLPESPVKIVAPAINLSATIANPISTEIGILDAALLNGAVRYPTSAKLGEDGNVVVFGHSSYLPIVHNQAYKTFDGIQDLKAGEGIMVYSSTRVYTYAVVTVTKVNADEGVIPLTVTGRILTLSTCDSFGTSSDRFVVTAEFVESHAISS